MNRFYSADEVEGGYSLIFPHAHPATLLRDQQIALEVQRKSRMVTDIDQIMVYDNKRAQTQRWNKWMPDTWVFEDKESALSFAESAEYTLISKADVGASSYNVRLIKNKADCITHIKEIFGKGLRVHHCDSQGTTSIQKDYVILQRFIPHDITYRVNIIGNQAAVFHRFCHKDRPMAQTGNVEPSYSPDDTLLEYARAVARYINSKWVALDILRDGDKWTLLETSLRWPWPSPGDCNNAPFTGGKKWNDMWYVLCDEIEQGSFL